MPHPSQQEFEELPADLKQELDARARSIPIFTALGFQGFEYRRGQVVCRVPWNRDFDGIFATFHGGILMTVADSAAAFAVLSVVGSKETIATTEMSIRFLAPMRSDVTATATVLKAGRTLVPVEVTLEDDRGALAALAHVTYLRLGVKP